MGKKAAIIVPIVLVGGFGAMMFMGACAIGAVTLVTVAGVAGTYYALSDNNTKEIEYDPNFTFEGLANRAIADCLDYTTSDQQIRISVTEQDLNDIIHWGLTKANMQDNQYLTKVYCDIHDHHYDFYGDLNGVVIKSRVKIATTLGETEDGKSFIFSIEDIKLGKIGGLFRPAVSLFSSYIDEQQINDFFTSAGLSMRLDKEQYALIYNKDDVIKDLRKAMKGDSTDTLFEIIDVMYTNELVQFGYETANFLDLNINLNKLATNEFVTDDSSHLMIKASEVDKLCKQRIITLVNKKVIADTDESAQKLLFTYFLRGYAPLTSEQKSKIDGYDLSSVGIKNNSLYVPEYVSEFVVNNNEQILFDKMKDQIMTLDSFISSDTTENKKITLLNESDLNFYIASRDLTGTLMLMHRQTESGYKLNYLVVDNFYCNIYNKGDEQLAELVCKLNINGFHTSLTFETNAFVQNNESLTFKIKENGIKFGTISAKELTDRFFDAFANALNGVSSTDGATITADAKAKTITVKFTGMVDDAKKGIKSSLKASLSANIPSSIPAMYKAQFEEFVSEAVEDGVDETFKQENAEIIIDGENRDANGTLQLVLKQNNFKKAFAEDVKASYETTFDAPTRAMFELAGFDIDAFITTLIGPSA